jgi:hypothetical protein
VIEAARRAGLVLRAIGGVAVALHSDPAIPRALRRRYQDIDIVVPKRHGAGAVRLLAQLGYEPHHRFNALNSERRMIVFDPENGRQIDIFVGSFRMCHAIPIANRLHIETHTVPLAELLLTKLQVVELTAKDIADILALVLLHDVGEGDLETINHELIAALLAEDWGLWRTVRGTTETVTREIASSQLESAQQALIADRLARLWARVEAQPRSLRWRARSRIGERIRWYDLPEEIDRPTIDRAAGRTGPDGFLRSDVLRMQEGEM